MQTDAGTIPRYFIGSICCDTIESTINFNIVLQNKLPSVTCCYFVG